MAFRLPWSNLLAPRKAHQLAKVWGRWRADNYHYPLKNLIAFKAMLLGNIKMIETMTFFLPSTLGSSQDILQAHLRYTWAPCCLDLLHGITIPPWPHPFMTYCYVACSIFSHDACSWDLPSGNSHPWLRPYPIHQVESHGSILQTNIYAFNCALLLSFIFSSSEAFISNLQPDAVNACAIANCGKGSCQDTDNSSFGFQCDCYSGWNQFQVGSLILPPCIVPNCTLNFDCAGENPSPPTPPEPVFNLSDLVAIPGAVMAAVRQRGVATNAIAMQAPIICAIPQPYPVSTHVSFLTLGFESCSNLLHILAATVLCIGSGSLGADCHDLGVGTPPRDHSSSPPGLREIRKVSPIKDSWTLLILGPIFLPLL
ncbi:hypothetical protein GOBAR_AA00059 [Gossypium barbadense]|uniref:EGF-like domain-containing protein n=1 Tax=Gossypium barbadense TaxID=3634 RepID=A0A2P5YY49_GOSBA|nr:hypothetical protein GOBAR_AA00059 [Gossypium barbadense]